MSDHIHIAPTILLCLTCLALGTCFGSWGAEKRLFRMLDSKETITTDKDYAQYSAVRRMPK